MAAQDLRGHHREGDAVAAIAQHRVAVLHARHGPDRRRAGGGGAEIPAPTIVGARVDMGQELGQLGFDGGDLRRAEGVARLGIAERLVFAAADDPAGWPDPQVEIGIGSFPDEAMSRPQASRLGGVAMAQVVAILWPLRGTPFGSS
jgi:hypothetical protein